MATTTKVQISNFALSNLGTRSTIESFTEASPEAKQSNLWYDFARVLGLESFDWSFARKRVDLVKNVEDPPEGVWAYRYNYPIDCVSARKIENPNGDDADAVPFTVEANSTGIEKTILTNMEDACLVYTWDLEDPSQFTNYFVVLLSFLLAYLMAMSLTGKASIRDRMLDQFNDLLRRAPAMDANEMVDKPPRDPDWIRFRIARTIGVDRDWEAYPDAQN